MYADGLPIEVVILQDRDVVMREVFPDERLAMSWSELYGERLKLRGWQEASEGTA